jgi:hypothetical protein
MFKKNLYALAIAATTGAGLLAFSASPSLACYVTATACDEASANALEAQAAQGAQRSLYNMAPGSSTTASQRARQSAPRAPATADSK